MILFLTSSPTGDLDGRYTCEGFDTRNGFRDEVRKVWPDSAKVLMITAFPDDHPANEQMGEFFENAIRKTGLELEAFALWERSILEGDCSREAVHSYDVIILGGGHIPTQLAFFEDLGLRDKLQDFNGIIIGMSAGSMDLADTVYAQPEEPGEATDPSYDRFPKGLGLTDVNILPHYQMVRDMMIDGMHLYNDVTIPDSYGRRFIVLKDGSYVVDYANGQVEVFGEASIITDGKMYEICKDNDKTTL